MSVNSEAEFKQIKRGHGGARPGAGRKPGDARRPRCAACGDARAAALASAVRGARAIQFITAMLALGSDIDTICRALNLSRNQFATTYLAELRPGGPS
ncbi:hypothetical protein TM233_58910 [Bradyrhizobium sp. TM233]|nr:hypothetical protein TM233_58910 [Bradyrhizobium sp. TM233]